MTGLQWGRPGPLRETGVGTATDEDTDGERTWVETVESKQVVEPPKNPEVEHLETGTKTLKGDGKVKVRENSLEADTASQKERETVDAHTTLGGAQGGRRGAGGAQTQHPKVTGKEGYRTVSRTAEEPRREQICVCPDSRRGPRRLSVLRQSVK